MSDCLIRVFFVVVEKTYLTQSLYLRHFGEGIVLIGRLLIQVEVFNRKEN